MLITPITDQVAQALKRLLTQYQQQPRITALITALVQQLQELDDAGFPVNDGRQLWNGTTYPAVGAQLDGIGELVGIQRNGLSDAEYLIFILGTIAENFSDTTITTITNIVQIFFQPLQLLSFENFPAEVAFQVAGSNLDPSLFVTVADAIQASLGAGIRLGYISTFSNTNAFKLGSALPFPILTGSAGFGDATSPGTGGELAGVIYNNSGD